jgi:YVTN family beta-propeller protein
MRDFRLASCFHRLFMLGALLGMASAYAAPFAYISNYTSNSVSVIDTATKTVVATVPVGSAPLGVAVNRVGTLAYVANQNDNTVSVIDTTGNTVVATVPVGTNPRGVAINPAATYVYVANQSSNNVSVIDTASNTVVATVPVGSGSYGIAVNATGTIAYVVNEGSASVSVIDTGTNTVVATVPVAANPVGVAVNPAGTFVYVTKVSGNAVAVIDTGTNAVVATVPVGSDPFGIAVNPAGTFAYAANAVSSTVSVIDTTANAVVATVPVGASPFGVAVNPAGTFVYVANAAGNTVSVIDAGTNSVVATVAVGMSPESVGNFISGSPATNPCGMATYPFPYTDVAGVAAAFCPGIMEAYVTGISKGTSPTTFSPNDPVIRLQMTTFLQRSLDQGLVRASRRAALNLWWTPQTMQTISVGGAPIYCAADGEDIWVSTQGQVVQVRASTGKVLGTWTGVSNNVGVIVAASKVLIAGSTGDLYAIDPTQAPGTAAVAASNVGTNSFGIAFDGTNIWTANLGPPGSVSIITPQATTPFPVTTVTTGFNAPEGILYDGAHVWVTDTGAGTLLKLDAAGAILQTVTVGSAPLLSGFDGTNIWVPNNGSNSVTVVQASSGNVVATITADASNNLNAPVAASFDGERVLVTNFGNSVTVFKAADLSLIANAPTAVGSIPYGACSDGLNFWIPLVGSGNLLRF